jgi:hypothetical protein
MNENGKPWYLSKGFIGPLVTAILFGLRSLGIADVDTETVLGVLYHAAEFAGLITGMVGRALARDRLTLGLQPAAAKAKQSGPPAEDPSRHARVRQTRIRSR